MILAVIKELERAGNRLNAYSSGRQMSNIPGKKVVKSAKELEVEAEIKSLNKRLLGY
jgi:hypothetical protein